MNPDKTICALVLRLIAGGRMKLEPGSGRLVHAAFLEVMRRIDPALSEQLHSANQRKPYTTSPLWADTSWVQEGDDAFVRLVMLDPTLAHKFVQQFMLRGRNHQLVLGRIPFAIAEVYATADSHARAGQFTLTSLPTSSFDSVRIDFLTPTAFSRNHGQVTAYETTMLPRHVWGYARRLWTHAGGEVLGTDFDDWCEHHTTITYSNVEIQQVDFQKFYMPGTVGAVAYRLVNVEGKDTFRQWWCRLAQFMPFCSLGYKTTMGMGQCVISQFK